MRNKQMMWETEEKIIQSVSFKRSKNVFLSAEKRIFV